MKVHELITMLQQYNPLAEVIATWEGITAIFIFLEILLFLVMYRKE
jgi:hypothetical protein